MNSTFPQATDAPIVIIGGGGHTRVLIDVLEQLGAKVEGIVTQDKMLLGQTMLGVPVIGLDKDFKGDPAKLLLVNGVGNKARSGDSGLRVRQQVVEQFTKLGFKFASVISKDARVSVHNKLAEGVQILHGAMIQPATRIDAHTIVNTGALVEHDCVIGSYCHLAPAAVLCGNVRIGNLVHIGANSTVVQELIVGEKAVIGAGIRVARNVAPGETVK
jgi:sugar O-acyltransferase (sialic acid O-acetyltransferase NeuD family)